MPPAPGKSWGALPALVPEPHLHIHGHIQAFAGRCSRRGFLLLLLQPLLLGQALLLFLGPVASRTLETMCMCSPSPTPAPRGQAGKEAPATGATRSGLPNPKLSFDPMGAPHAQLPCTFFFFSSSSLCSFSFCS